MRKEIRTIASMLAALAVVALFSMGAAPVSPPLAGHPPYDYQAVFKTQVPHAKSSHGGGGGGGGGGNQSGGGSSTVTFGGTPYSVGTVMTPTSTMPEAEEHIAVDPTNSSNLVAAISDFSQRGGYNTTKYAISTDNGTTWEESFVPLSDSYPTTSDDQIWEANSDPVVAIDRYGNFYLANLYFNASNNANGVYVGVGTLSAGSIAQSSTFPVTANLDAHTTITDDKEWIAVDNNQGGSYSGRVYVSWTRFDGSSDYVLLSYLTYGGQTWSTPVQINPSVQNGAVQGSQVAVGPDGTVYVVYEVFYVGGQRQQMIAASHDGGVSFGTAVAATPVFNELSFNSTYRKNSFASLAVAQVTNSNYIYLVYSDQPSSSAGAQVEFVQSTAASRLTFTSPLAINDASSGQQFMPSVAVDESGTIHANWFDTRNNSRTTSYYDIYATYSTDGSTFAPNARVTSASVNAGRGSFIGDYGGIAAAGGAAHPVWTSGGFNNGRLQTVVLTH